MHQIMAFESVSVDLGLESTHVLVTGAGGHIGRHVVSCFLSAGAHVTCLDISKKSLHELNSALAHHGFDYPASSDYFTAPVDISNEHDVREAFAQAYERFGTVQCCVALAALDLSVLDHHESIVNMPLDQWRRTFDVNVHGTFLTAREWTRQLSKSTHRDRANVSLIIVGSESGSFGERGNADYAASKSAVQFGLLQSLKADIPRRYPGARVNAIAPGPVDTPRFKVECNENPKQLWEDAEATTALGKPVSMASVARSIVYLASSNFSGNVHGQVLSVDSGKQGKLMYKKGEAKQFYTD